MTAPYFSADGVTVYLGDCLDVLRALPDGSVDAVVCDPPYALAELATARVLEALAAWMRGDRDYVPDGPGGFMNRSWDRFVPPPGAWDECMRVLKPGGHLLAFASPRTVDLMGLSIRIAGLEIRDSIHWIFGSGFPKSRDVGKAIDRAAGAERQVIGRKGGRYATPKQDFRGGALHSGADTSKTAVFDAITAPATEEAARWDGWGTALKPAHEPIVVARKPLSGTVAQTVLEHGTGALNIGACRVPIADGDLAQLRAKDGTCIGVDDGRGVYGQGARRPHGNEAGRWPTNIIVSHLPECGPDDSTPCQPGCAVAELDRQSGASRFFPTFRYEAKAPASERPKLPDGTAHATVKPLSLMRWLIRLVTPPKLSILICSGCGKEVRGVRRDVQAEAVGTDSVFSRMSPEEGGACAEGSTETVPNMREGADRGKGPEVLQSGVLRTGSAEAEDVHDLRHRIPCSQTNASDLLTSMCREGDDAASADVRVVRREVPAQDEQDEILRSSLQRQGERTCETEAIPDDGEGLPGAVSAGSSDVESAGMRAGASQGDGRSPGTDASPDGGGASPQRDQGRQPRREPSSAIEAGARPHPETAAETDRVPSLSRTDRSLGTCPDCCAPLELSEGPGVVLDPFAGSGTTGEAAVVEGFRAVLIEREAPYAELIKTRLAKPIAPVLGFEGEIA